MAIQDLGVRPGGTATQSSINGPTVIKRSAGTLWSVNVFEFGSIGGSLYDSNTTAGCGPSNLLWSAEGVGPYTGAPIPFLKGLTWISDPATVATVGFA